MSKENENKEPMSAEAFLKSIEATPYKPWFDPDNNYYNIKASVMDRFADQKTAELRKELESHNLVCLELEETNNLLLTEKAKSEKMREALAGLTYDIDKSCFNDGSYTVSIADVFDNYEKAQAFTEALKSFEAER